VPKIAVAEVLRLTGGETTGSHSGEISRVRPLEDAGPDALSFLVDRSRGAAAESSGAAVILVPRDLDSHSDRWIRVDDPYFAFSQVLREWFWEIPAPEGVSSDAVIDASAVLASDVRIGPRVVIGEDAIIGEGVIIREGCSIGRGATIGRRSVLYPNVTIYHDVAIGERCIIHAGAVIGADGFGFATRGGRHHKIPQIGSVRIGNDVEIGACSTIDRGTLNDTVVGEGTKIDNQVMIAHNVQVGKHCFFAAQSGVAGSTEIGDYCAFGGQSGAVGHVRLGREVLVAAKTAVTKSFEGPVTLAGVPARPLRETRRSDALVRSLPRLIQRLEAVEAVLAGPSQDPPPEE
jgi:UDP-3-O-[3-hydroxymyristoyl] glucosamine N-acyltransferase